MPIELQAIAGYLNAADVRQQLAPLFLQGLNWGAPQVARRTLQAAHDLPAVLIAVVPVAELGGIPVFRIDWPAPTLPTVAQRRAVLRQLAPTAGEHVVCYVSSDQRQLAFVFARARPNGKTELRTLPYDVGSPARTTIERLALLHFEFNQLGMFGPEPLAVLAKLNAAFDAEAVSKQFFQEYRRIFGHAKTLITGVDGDAKQLFTQTLFNRLMFIVFLEQYPRQNRA